MRIEGCNCLYAYNIDDDPGPPIDTARVGKRRDDPRCPIHPGYWIEVEATATDRRSWAWVSGDGSEGEPEPKVR